MKNNLKFFVTVISLLLASTLILAGCIYAVAESETPPQSYLMGDRIITEPIIDDTPISHKELEEKYSSMKSYNAETNTITLITSEYLEEYRKKIEENKAIPILTADEVHYIINDTIEMFYRGGYDGFILPGTAQTWEIERFPYAEETAYSAEIGQININTDTVYDIILHRLCLLSSPDSFFGTSFDDIVYYVPGLAAMTDRERLAEYFAGNTDSDIDESNIPYHFVFEKEGIYRDYIKKPIISSCSAGNIEKIYPSLISTSALTPQFIPLGTLSGARIIFDLDLINGGFVARTSIESFSLEGDFRREGDKLIFTANIQGAEKAEIVFQNDWVSTFICLTNFPELRLENGMVFWFTDYNVWEALENYISPLS